jgi:uncharacterized membrane protein YdfJ with MMPL/SSD domain
MRTAPFEASVARGMKLSIGTVAMISALLIDATIIRSVVFPSAMKLLGDWNWYLPRWLTWLPRLQVEQAGPGANARAAFQ